MPLCWICQAPKPSSLQLGSASGGVSGRGQDRRRESWDVSGPDAPHLLHLLGWCPLSMAPDLLGSGSSLSFYCFHWWLFPATWLHGLSASALPATWERGPSLNPPRILAECALCVLLKCSIGCVSRGHMLKSFCFIYKDSGTSLSG